MFLKKPKAYSILRPVSCKACWPFSVKDTNTFRDISSEITLLESSNSVFKRSSQWNGVLGFSNSRKGNILSVMLRVYETWLTSPNQERISVMFLGVGKSSMAWRYFLHGRTLSTVISNPANSTVSLPNLNLSGFNMMPCLPHMSNQCVAWWKLWRRLSAHRRVSSIHFVLLGIDDTISSYRLEYPSPEAMYPCGAVQYLYLPHGVIKQHTI